MTSPRSVILISVVTAAASIAAAPSIARTAARSTPAAASQAPVGVTQQLQALNDQIAELRNALESVRPRRFYLTKDLFTGGETLAACEAEFHMASLIEILDPSHLQYDAARGYQNGDSGEGPPTAALGWIRTASDNGTFSCQFWTSSGLATGASAELVTFSDWADPATHISPWRVRIGSTDTLRCDGAKRVWCVENR
jgi:hypothetical protein